MSETPFRPEARSPRGFQDRRPRDLMAERQILEAVARVYERYGFEPLDTPAFEYADALGKFLPDSDRPNEGVFSLQDDDEQWMALRYDLTAPLARFAAENWTSLAKPFRRYAYGTVWRNEKPGPGRFREFIQCDADTVGSDRPEADAEIVAMAIEGLEAAGVPRGSAVLKINNRKLLNGLMSTAGIHDAAQRLVVLRAVDKLDRLGIEGVQALLGKGRMDESGAFTPGAELETPAIEAVLAFLGASGEGRMATVERLSAVVSGCAEGAEGLEELSRIHTAFQGMGVDEERARFDPAVVRGLEYYTGPVYEADLIHPDTEGLRLGSMGGGGRYDDLVARFTGERTPATGFSFGVSRLAVALERFAELAARRVAAPRGPVVIIAFDEASMADYFAAARELRDAGVAAEVYLGRSGMKAQMKYADRRLSPAAVIIGDDERASGSVTVKDLDLGRELASALSDHRAWKDERPGQVTAPRGDLVATVRRIVERR
jgi:histidyl-tRNA synthetase